MPLSFFSPGLEMRISDLDAENSIDLHSSFAAGDFWTSSLTFTHTRWQPTFIESVTAGRIGDVQEITGGAYAIVPLLPTFSLLGGWSVRERHDLENEPFLDFTDSGPLAGFLWSNQSGVQARDPSWGMAGGATFFYYDETFGGDRDLYETFTFLEMSHDFAQDWILGARLTYTSLDGGPFLQDEDLALKRSIRGVEEDFEGRDMAVLSVELRFPIVRDLNFMPFDWMSVGETFLLKDLRGFVFVQGGHAADHFSDFERGRNGAASVGAGIRVDTFFMIWPIVNTRVPARIEFWWAWVMQDEVRPGTEFGVGITL